MNWSDDRDWAIIPSIRVFSVGTFLEVFNSELWSDYLYKSSLKIILDKYLIIFRIDFVTA